MKYSRRTSDGQIHTEIEGNQTCENVLSKPLAADFKSLFKALAKGVTHGAVGKWEEIGNDTVEALSAIGLKTEPGELCLPS